MAVYIVNYYLKEEEHDCNCENEEEHHHHHHADAELIWEIKALGEWAHFMPSSFLLHTSLSAEEILNKLKTVVKENDLLFVAKVDSKSSASLTPQVIEWISKIEDK